LAELINQSAELAIHANTALPLALSMARSEVREFFESTSYSNYRKGLEARQKMSIAVLSRFDGVIKSIGGVGKLLHAIGKRR
jgi:hypothetical protein